MSPAVEHQDAAELDEIRQLLRYAAQELTEKQRFAIQAFMNGWTDEEAGKERGLGRQAVFELRKRALRQMRRRLLELKITSSLDVFTTGLR